jgi:oligopeptide transport system ATP-binding protein
MNSKNLVEISNLKKYFKISRAHQNSFKKDVVYAVDGVSFDIKEGETIGLVGESGCGKTTLGRCVLKLIEPDSGTVKFDGVDIAKMKKSKVRMIRKDMQIIFQDPFSSLDPRMKVGDIINEPFTVFGVPGGEDKYKKMGQLLDAVGLGPECLQRFPHEFSGGQRQRIAIARSLALNPRFIVADEPISALDVSTRAQILNLMKRLKKD